MNNINSCEYAKSTAKRYIHIYFETALFLYMVYVCIPQFLTSKVGRYIDLLINIQPHGAVLRVQSGPCSCSREWYEPNRKSGISCEENWENAGGISKINVTVIYAALNDPSSLFGNVECTWKPWKQGEFRKLLFFTNVPKLTHSLNTHKHQWILLTFLYLHSWQIHSKWKRHFFL